VVVGARGKTKIRGYHVLILTPPTGFDSRVNRQIDEDLFELLLCHLAAELMQLQFLSQPHDKTEQLETQHCFNELEFYVHDILLVCLLMMGVLTQQYPTLYDRCNDCQHV